MQSLIGTTVPDASPPLVRAAQARLRHEHARATSDPWAADVWPRALLPGGDRPRSPNALSFEAIRQPWLRELAKCWARLRLEATGTSPHTINVSLTAIRAFSIYLQRAGSIDRAEDLRRAHLEGYRGYLRDRGLKPRAITSYASAVNTLLEDARTYELAAISAGAKLFKGELGNPSYVDGLPRRVDPQVMAQLDQRLDEIGHLPSRAAITLLIDTGLRIVDVATLAIDPLRIGPDGAPYLQFVNRKRSREALIPITPRAEQAIREQQARVRASWPAGAKYLFPREKNNPDGEPYMSTATLRKPLYAWVEACDLRDTNGVPARVTPHMFRHTLGTTMLNQGVPMEIVRRYLDHASIQMTAVYARIEDDTLRREFDRFQRRVNVLGEVIDLPDDPALADAAWLKDALSRAKQALPNGYCTLPLRQTCPHPNACLTCPSFATDASFRPIHEEQRKSHRELIARAKEAGNMRIVELNERPLQALDRICDALDEFDSEQRS